MLFPGTSFCSVSRTEEPLKDFSWWGGFANATHDLVPHRSWALQTLSCFLSSPFQSIEPVVVVDF